MLKKIALLVVLFALPLGAMAQKFAHMNSQEVIVAMPEYTKAQADLDAMSKQYQEEMQRSQTEFNKKVQEFQQQADSLPKNIAERRQEFQQDAYQNMQKAQQDALVPIYKKLDEAIQAVGKAEGVIYIFDLARTPIPYVGSESVDVTAKVKTQLGIK